MYMANHLTFAIDLQQFSSIWKKKKSRNEPHFFLYYLWEYSYEDVVSQYNLKTFPWRHVSLPWCHVPLLSRPQLSALVMEVCPDRFAFTLCAQSHLTLFRMECRHLSSFSHPHPSPPTAPSGTSVLPHLVGDWLSSSHLICQQNVREV